MQTLQLEKIKRSVEVSSVLTAPERTQWLEMLPLMNDKQLLELEAMLSAPKKPAQAGAAQPGAAANASNGQGHLGHISNLPSNITFGMSSQKPISAQPQQGVQKPQAPSPVAQTNIPPSTRPAAPVRPQAVAPRPQPVAPAVSPVKPSSTLAPSPVKASAASTPAPVPSPAQQARPLSPVQQLAAKRVPESVLNKTQPLSKPALSAAGGTSSIPPTSQSPNAPVKPVIPSASAGVKSSADLPKTASLKPQIDYRNLVNGGPTAIGSLNDATSMTVATLRVVHPASVLDALARLVRSEGYFNVWFAVQQSPLYQIYIHTGQMMLEGKTDASALTKEEFENVADIFKEIQES